MQLIGPRSSDWISSSLGDKFTWWEEVFPSTATSRWCTVRGHWNQPERFFTPHPTFYQSHLTLYNFINYRAIRNLISSFKSSHSSYFNSTKIIIIRRVLISIFSMLPFCLVTSPYPTRHTLIQFIKEFLRDYIPTSLQCAPQLLYIILPFS
jgi:hypothetical protein